MNRPPLRLAALVAATALGMAGCGSHSTGAPPFETPSAGAPATATTAGTPATATPTDASTDDSTDDSTGADAAAYAHTPVAQIEKDLTSALSGATSLHMSGAIVQNHDEVDLDVSVDTAGDCTGTMALHDNTIRLRGVSGHYYFRAPRSFWQSEDAAHVAAIWSIVAGKWVKMGGGGQSSEMSSLCNLTEFTKSVMSSDRQTRVVGPSQFQGVPTVELSDETSDGTKTTIQVLASAPHYPVRVDAGSQGEITFSRFNQKVEVAAPSTGETVDLGGLG